MQSQQEEHLSLEISRRLTQKDQQVTGARTFERAIGRDSLGCLIERHHHFAELLELNRRLPCMCVINMLATIFHPNPCWACRGWQPYLCSGLTKKSLNMALAA